MYASEVGKSWRNLINQLTINDIITVSPQWLDECHVRLPLAANLQRLDRHYAADHVPRCRRQRNTMKDRPSVYVNVTGGFLCASRLELRQTGL